MSEIQRIVALAIDAYRRGFMVVIKHDRQILHGAAIVATGAAALFQQPRTRAEKLLSSYPVQAISTSLSASEWMDTALPNFFEACEWLALAGHFPAAPTREEKLQRLFQL